MTPVSDHPQQQNSPDQSAAGRPTIVLVHGAFADSSSWVAVDRALAAKGYTAISVANPLRGLDGDAAYTASVAATIDGPVVLVGHSYAGAVITQAAAALENVVGLVYVAAFIPEIGETSNDLNARFPGSLLVPENLIARPTADGKMDLYIRPERFGDIVGGPSSGAVVAAAIAQRPITVEALGGALREAPARSLPMVQVAAQDDHAVPTQLQHFMAERAGAHVVEADCGHGVPVLRPDVAAGAIIELANSAVTTV